MSIGSVLPLNSNCVNLTLASTSSRGKAFGLASSCFCRKPKPKLQMVYMYKTDLFKNQLLLTNTILYHNFVLLEMENGKCWTIEKNDKGIVLQITGKCKQDAIKYLGTEERKSPPSEQKSQQARRSFRDLEKWLESNGEYDKAYDTVNDNCQHFALRVYNYLT